MLSVSPNRRTPRGGNLDSRPRFVESPFEVCVARQPTLAHLSPVTEWAKQNVTTSLRLGSRTSDNASGGARINMTRTVHVASLARPHLGVRLFVEQ